MCLALPMRVLEHDGTSALCERRGELRRVSLLFVDDVTVGATLLVHVDTALRVLGDEEARLVEDAIDCLEAANAGRPLDGYFADLTDREPQLPPHLQKPGTT